MYPAQFDYHTPGSIKEALDLLGKHKDDAKLLAGGHSLLPAMKLRLARPAHLVDLRKVPGLTGIREDGGSLVIGAMTTHYAVESSSAVKSKCPVLAATAALIGDPMVRNMGTIGGSLAHADPAADYPATIIALNAEMVVEGARGKRTIKVDDFFKGLMTTAVGGDEILTEVRVPAGWKSTYWKLRRRGSFDFPILGVAAALKFEKEVISEARIALGAVASRPFLVEKAGEFLKGKTLSDEVIAKAAELVANRAKPMDNTDMDLYWRKEVADDFTGYALRELRGDDMRETRLRIARAAIA